MKFCGGRHFLCSTIVLCSSVIRKEINTNDHQMSLLVPLSPNRTRPGYELTWFVTHLIAGIWLMRTFNAGPPSDYCHYRGAWNFRRRGVNVGVSVGVVHKFYLCWLCCKELRSFSFQMNERTTWRKYIPCI